MLSYPSTSSRPPPPSYARPRSPDSEDNLSDERDDGPASSSVPSAVTLDTELSSSNRGYGMLVKLGWKAGVGLGLDGSGRTTPIPLAVATPGLGIGKFGQDLDKLDGTIGSGRKELLVERKETYEQRKMALEEESRKQGVKEEILATIQPFFCADCAKQYKNVGEYDSHLTSYDHHHTVRLRALALSHRRSTQAQPSDRQAKERKREEKEMRQMMKAAGVAAPDKPKKKKKIDAGPSDGLTGTGGWGTFGKGKVTQRWQGSSTAADVFVPPPPPSHPPPPPSPPPAPASPPPAPPAPLDPPPSPPPPPSSFPTSNPSSHPQPSSSRTDSPLPPPSSSFLLPSNSLNPGVDPSSLRESPNFSAPPKPKAYPKFVRGKPLPATLVPSSSSSSLHDPVPGPPSFSELQTRIDLQSQATQPPIAKKRSRWDSIA